MGFSEFKSEVAELYNLKILNNLNLPNKFQKNR